MKYSIPVLVLLLTAVLTVAGITETADNPAQTAKDNSKSPKSPVRQPKDGSPDSEPLLLLDDEPPLMLDDEDDPSAQGQKMADNGRCHVCHLNFADEDIAVVHAKADVGCAKCHGDCDEHIADESWAVGGNGTAPGKMFRRGDIDSFCRKCHKGHDVPAREVIAHWQKRHAEKPEKIGKIAPDQIICTDCHGDHSLHTKERKCKWK